MTLPTFVLNAVAAERLPLSIGIACPHSAQQQTRRTLLPNDGTDRLFHRPCFTYSVGSVNKGQI